MFSFAICCPTGDKWQLKTLFLTIFYLRSLIVLTCSIAACPVCSGDCCHLLITLANRLGPDQDLPKHPLQSSDNYHGVFHLARVTQFSSNSFYSNIKNHICANLFGFAEIMIKTLQYSILEDIPVADPEGDQGVHLNPPLWPPFLNIL